MFQLADTRRRAGSSAMDNTPFARWKKALPSLPFSKSIDSDDRKASTGDEIILPSKKKKGINIYFFINFYFVLFLYFLIKCNFQVESLRKSLEWL